MNIYNNSFNDDTCHEHVLAARRAGRSWAEREYYEAASNETRSNLAGSNWYASNNDAYELVSFGPNSEVSDQYEREEELQEICNGAARERWNQLTAEPASDNDCTIYSQSGARKHVQSLTFEKLNVLRKQLVMCVEVERCLAVLQACNHLPSGPEAGWCNLCGAIRTRDGHWVQPHWRDLILMVHGGG